DERDDEAGVEHQNDRGGKRSARRAHAASAANVAAATNTNGNTSASAKRRASRHRSATSPPTTTVANGRAASSAQGTTGSTRVEQSVSPMEPGGVSYASSPHHACPPANQSSIEAGTAARTAV